MSETKKINKVVFGGETLIDLSSDTVTEADVQQGVTFHLPDGNTGTGTSTKDSDTSDATALVAEILDTKTAYARGTKLTGTMPNRGSVSGEVTTRDGAYTIPQGYHDGSGTVGIPAADKAKLIPENIRQGITILSIEGNMSGSEDVNAETKNVTPTKTAQTILPSAGYNYIAQVNLAAIPYVLSENAAGGQTATIA